MNLEEIRNEIDQIDLQVVQLLEKRMQLVQKIIETKQIQNIHVLDASREQTILKQVEQNVKNPAYRAPLLNTYKSIMKHSRLYQQAYIKKH